MMAIKKYTFFHFFLKSFFLERSGVMRKVD